MATGFATLLCTFPFTGAASQAPDPFELSPEQLFDAKVTSVSKTSEKVMDAAAAVYVLNNEDIRRSGATSIPEALRLVPGVQVARVNANSWAISVRGFNSGLANKLLVLMDGREVYDPLFSGVYWDIQDTALEDIERIEVIRGPGASLWGANAVNGVINIITKNSADTQGALVSALAGNKISAQTTARYGGKFSENGTYRAYGKYLNTDDETRLNGASANDGQEASRGGFRADWKSADSHDSFTLQGDAYDSESGQPRIIGAFTAPLSRTVQEDLMAHGGNILGRWTRDYADSSKFSLQSYLDYTAREQQLINDQRTSFDLQAQYEMPAAAGHKIIVGGTYRLSIDDLGDKTQLASFTDARRNDQLFSAFFQDKVTLEDEKWFLTLGSKLEHNDYTGFEIQPNARLQYHPDSGQMVWASASRAVRTTSRLENDLQIVQTVGGGGAVSLDTLPNTDFKSETLAAYELGYRNQILPELSLDVASFYNMYSRLSTYNFLGFIAGTDPARVVVAYQPLNNTSAEAYGIETSLDWRVLENWNLSGSYSLLDLQLHGPLTGGLGAEAAETQSPTSQFNIRSQWDISKELAFDTELYYVSGLKNFGVDGYYRLDTRLGWQVTDGLQFDLVGQNLLDPEHREFYAANDQHTPSIEIGRSVYGRFTWRF